METEGPIPYVGPGLGRSAAALLGSTAKRRGYKATRQCHYKWPHLCPKAAKDVLWTARRDLRRRRDSGGASGVAGFPPCAGQLQMSGLQLS